ncbi:unnamed protein product, partial [Polarella glacialis]
MPAQLHDALGLSPVSEWDEAAPWFEVWVGLVTHCRTLPAALNEAQLAGTEEFGEQELKRLCQVSDATDDAEYAAGLLLQSMAATKRVPRAAMLDRLVAYSPRLRFRDWANNVLLAYDRLPEMAIALSNGMSKGSCSQEALLRDWQSSGKLLLTRTQFCEALILHEIRSEDSAAWFEAI